MAHTPEIPEMMPKATTLSTQYVVLSCAVICSGSSFCTGASCAIQMPSHAIAKNAIQRPVTLRVGSAKTAVVWVSVMMSSRW